MPPETMRTLRPVGAVVAVLLLFAGATSYAQDVTEEATASDAGCAAETAALPCYWSFPQLQAITFNVAGTNAERTATVGVSLGVKARKGSLKPAAVDALRHRLSFYLPKVRAVVLDEMRTKFIDELDADLDGTAQAIAAKLNEAVFARLSPALGVPGGRGLIVTEVLFTDFLIR